MSTNRITRITVRFEDGNGSEVIERTYIVLPDTAYIQATNPMGRVPGYLKLKGAVQSFKDENKGESR